MQRDVIVAVADVHLNGPAKSSGLPEEESEQHRVAHSFAAARFNLLKPGLAGEHNLLIRGRRRVEVESVTVSDDALESDAVL